MIRTTRSWIAGTTLWRILRSCLNQVPFRYQQRFMYGAMVRFCQSGLWHKVAEHGSSASTLAEQSRERERGREIFTPCHPHPLADPRSRLRCT